MNDTDRWIALGAVFLIAFVATLAAALLFALRGEFGAAAASVIAGLGLDLAVFAAGKRIARRPPSVPPRETIYGEPR